VSFSPAPTRRLRRCRLCNIVTLTRGTSTRGVVPACRCRPCFDPALNATDAATVLRAASGFDADLPAARVRTVARDAAQFRGLPIGVLRSEQQFFDNRDTLRLTAALARFEQLCRARRGTSRCSWLQLLWRGSAGCGALRRSASSPSSGPKRCTR
jgi:hypothetical protein